MESRVWLSVCRGRLTLQWVVETGRPMLEATTTVRAEASSMLKPLQEKERKKKRGMNVCKHAG